MATATGNKKRINSRSKGKVGELELAHYLTERGYAARRGQQFSGGAGSPDVICETLGNFHLEVKRTETLNLYKSLAQSIKDAGNKKTPLVIHRKSKQEWVCIIRLEDLLNQILYTGI